MKIYLFLWHMFFKHTLVDTQFHLAKLCEISGLLNPHFLHKEVIITGDNEAGKVAATQRKTASAVLFGQQVLIGAFCDLVTVFQNS